MAEIPAFLQEQTEENIMQRMLERVPSDIDKSEGSFIWDAQAPVAFVLAEAAGWAQQVLQRGFAGTAFGEYLDLRVAEHGVTRRGAVAAHGMVRFTGTPGKLIPSGVGLATPADEISSESSIEYVTTAEVTLDGEGVGEAPIRAVEAGRSGNVPAGVITVMATPISGITAVVNPEATTGGTDIESDESLLERFYARVRNQGTSGNKAQYIQWAGEVAGVGAVQVQPLWQGPGTVGIYLLDSEKRAANTEIVEATQNYIDPTMDGQGEGMAPAGPIVTVMAAEEVPINISVRITLSSGVSLADVKTEIENGVTAYLKQLAFVDTSVRVTRIAAVLLDIPSIIDYANLTVNGTSDTNIDINFGQVAVLGTVDVHE
ncbi:baseplate J-like protein [Paenibacillus antibioticophila]|uniref:Baseplate J-like protein n=1 Tax=Paenibacillus antibioticophila TaxID=1274374 RepID=A0A919XSH6_9BACL|nr:baseplate J/gp47 family protein [Paenibacillus antibioticophila]GIO35857.1 baseplate J-like protein [Paenibacillus antibioticophila]